MTVTRSLFIRFLILASCRRVTENHFKLAPFVLSNGIGSSPEEADLDSGFISPVREGADELSAARASRKLARVSRPKSNARTHLRNSLSKSNKRLTAVIADRKMLMLRP